MVRGIEEFKKAFAEYADNYVVIGGTACEHYEDESGQISRATKDIDIILVVEALSDVFVAKFWEFIKVGQYDEKQIGKITGEPCHQYYRFKSPANQAFPVQIELFSRSLGIFNIPKEIHITPIPTGSDLSSLSAILMDDDYYHYTIEHSDVIKEIHFANIESLIVLKCKAYLEMKKLKNNGGQVDSKHIRKHRNDVFRMVAALSSGERFTVPAPIFNDVEAFCKAVIGDMPEINLIENMGLKNITPQQLLERLNNLFEVRI